MKEVLERLEREQLLMRVSNSNELIQKELDSLHRLESRNQNYLTRYDIFFRYVSILILKKGYSFTRNKPHKALLNICMDIFENVSSRDIEEVITCRHDLKYNKKKPISNAENTLNLMTNEIQKMLLNSENKLSQSK